MDSISPTSAGELRRYKPTGRLRWRKHTVVHDGIASVVQSLQHEFLVEIETVAMTTKHFHEWRDVPIEDET